MAHFFPKLREGQSKLVVPPQLLMYCNLIEALRMREELIIQVAETDTLTTYFKSQAKAMNASSMSTMSANPLGLTVGRLNDG